MSDSETPTPEQLDVLIESIRGQSGEVAGLRKDLGKQGEALKEAKWLTRRSIFTSRISLTVGALAVIVAALAVGQSWRTNDALEESETQRLERSIASCQQSNDFYRKHNALVRHDQQTWIDARDRSDSAQLKEFAQTRIDDFEKDKVPLRDCSPEGIAAYLSTTTTTP